ncbi:acyltransferase family protein [Undibacterium flavidum]|uniref:Acyltransferase n=1 Tax=Undibacterium flavidum TaxID=2762297 RepID=A0ABR6YER6_9BURK|nr:acyltransferase [Undibacterium flavidum]MBC3875038.1 acyltransferase [Undibacterium flavidum]
MQLANSQKTFPLSSDRNFGIDLLRGLSILFVVVHHLAMSFRLPLGPSYLGDFVSKRVINGISFNGYESVFVFFVLSGFLITRRSLTQYGNLSAIDWRKFYTQRFSRIFPLLALLLVVLSLMHGLEISGYVVQEKGQTLWRALLSALGLHLNWYEGQTTWLPAAWDVLWSLSIEEVFYLAFPLICIVLPRRWLVAGLLILAFSLPWTREAIVSNEIWKEKAYLPGMSAIAFGVLTALLAQAWKTSEQFARSIAVLGGIGLIAIYFFGSEVWKVIHGYSMLILCLSACLLAFAAQRLAPRPRWGWQWLAKMGYLSYEIYLSHMFIVLSVCTAYRAYFGENMRWTFVVYVPVVVACLLLGVLLERWVSNPAMQYLRSKSFK